MSTLTETSSLTTIGTADMYRLTVDQYEQMAANGFLDDHKVGLIDGLLVRKVTENPPHNWTRDDRQDQPQRDPSLSLRDDPDRREQLQPQD
jgi:hypothetical protein